MLCVISPAKKLAANPPRRLPLSSPRLLEDAAVLAKQLAALSPRELASLMSISDQLAQLNVARFQAWQADLEEHAGAALLTFTGDTYVGFDAAGLNDQNLAKAQDRVRILSGLYGLLRPLDGIHPYRLGMGCKLANPRGANLYDYWREGVTNLLKEDLRAVGSNTLVNLASQEYAQAIDQAALGARVITPRFLDAKNGKPPKMLQLYVKRARGMMARYMVETNAGASEALQGFDQLGYSFNPSLSKPDQPTFVRIH